MDILSHIRLNYLELENHDQTPKPKSKFRFIICFIIIVSATISAFLIWKSHLQNPLTAIQTACSMTYKQRLCFDSISSLQRNSSTSSSNANPSKIFALSLQVSINELKKLNPFLERLISKARWEWTVQSLTNCEAELNLSENLLNMSLALIHDDTNQDFFRERNISRYLREKILNASLNVDKCRSLLVLTELYDESRTRNKVRIKLKEVRFYIDNSYLIFYNMDKIHQQLNPSIGSITESHYAVANMVLHLAPYIFLGILIFLMVKTMYFATAVNYD